MTFDQLEDAGIHLHAMVAMASNGVIGRDGALPWHLSEDLRLFKQRTLGHPIIMGRATFESLPRQRPLPRRRNIVLSRTLPARQGIEVIASMDELPDLGLRGDAYLIGGARVFQAHLAICSTIILTYIYEAHPGDTFMPAFENDFVLAETLNRLPRFEVRRYLRRGISRPRGPRHRPGRSN